MLNNTHADWLAGKILPITLQILNSCLHRASIYAYMYEIYIRAKTKANRPLKNAANWTFIVSARCIYASDVCY